MKNKIYLSLTILLFTFIIFIPKTVKAWECYVDPVYERDLWGQYNIAAYVLEKECSGTAKLETVAAGTVLHIIAETDGWYKVETNNGNIGWTGSSLMTVVNEPEIVPEPVLYEEEEILKQVQNDSIDLSFKDRVKGQLLLQVQQNGEIWYVDPIEYKRYYVSVTNALPLFRKLSLGITNNDLATIPLTGSSQSSSLGNRLKGRLLLAVEDLGRVWYVDMKGQRREVREDNIMTIFRALGLGITDTDLNQIPIGDLEGFGNDVFEVAGYEEENLSFETESSFQRGEIPSNIDLVKANEYWLSEINKLRAAQNLRSLVLDQRFANTATEWAGYTGEELGYMTHNRPDGKSMHQWIDTKDLDWTVRYSEPDGWVSNYFTENIAWNYIDGTTAGLEKAMDYTLDWMLAEASYNGDHYRTIYHPDWNCLGLGYYFEDIGNDRYKVYIVMHYGSLNQD